MELLTAAAAEGLAAVAAAAAAGTMDDCGVLKIRDIFVGALREALAS